MHTRPLQKLLIAVAAAIGLSASLTASAADPLKVGFVYIGPIGDHGWTYQHEQGRKALAEKFGDQITTTPNTNVPILSARLTGSGSSSEVFLRRFSG